MNKQEAIKILADEIFDINRSIGQARVIVQEIDEEFFAVHKVDTQEARNMLAYCFGRYAIMTDILSGIILSMKKTMDELGKEKKAGVAA